MLVYDHHWLWFAAILAESGNSHIWPFGNARRSYMLVHGPVADARLN